MTSVLITGARGFIGRHCVPELVKMGYEVHAVTSGIVPDDSESMRWYSADLLANGEARRIVRAARLNAFFTWHGSAITQSFGIRSRIWTGYALRFSSVRAFTEAGGERVVVSGSCAEYAIPDTGPCVEDLRRSGHQHSTEKPRPRCTWCWRDMPPALGFHWAGRETFSCTGRKNRRPKQYRSLSPLASVGVCRIFGILSGFWTMSTLRMSPARLSCCFILILTGR